MKERGLVYSEELVEQSQRFKMQSENVKGVVQVHLRDIIIQVHLLDTLS
jgi:hypothetical protein